MKVVNTDPGTLVAAVSEGGEGCEVVLEATRPGARPHPTPWYEAGPGLDPSTVNEQDLRPGPRKRTPDTVHSLMDAAMSGGSGEYLMDCPERDICLDIPESR